MDYSKENEFQVPTPGVGDPVQDPPSDHEAISRAVTGNSEEDIGEEIDEDLIETYADETDEIPEALSVEEEEEEEEENVVQEMEEELETFESNADANPPDHGEEESASIAEKIKRPSSAWMIYMNQNRSRLKEENPNLSIGEVAKTLSAEYKGLSQDLLDIYLELARKDKERYVEAMANRRNTGGDTVVTSKYPPLRDGETILPLVRTVTCLH